ncbi:hypothetical protein BGZ83_010836 [Gryganskiella cystojenkinii]|nr:hypothetical protein BGZ83_010836 [Gryganskiella cystojenkinii]
MDMYSYAEADVEADNDDDDDKSDEEVTQRTTDDESDIIVDSDHLYHQRTAIRRWSSPQVYCPVPSLSTTTTSTLVPSKRQIFATTRKQAHRNHNRAPKRYPKTSIHPWSPYNHAGDSDADEHNDSAEDDDEEQVYTTNMGNWKESWSIPSSSSICFPPLRQQLHRRHSSTGIRLSVRPVIGTSDATSRRRDSVYPGNRRDNTSSSNRNSNSGVRFHGLLPLTPLVPVRPFSTSSRRHSWAYTTTIRSGTASTSPTSNTSSSSAFVYNYGSAVSSTSTSPAPSRRNSGAISPRTCILQGFLARHSNGHQMYRRPSIKKCGSVCGAEHDHGDDSSSRSATDRGGDGDDEDEGRGGKDESDHDDEDEEEEDQRFLLLAQSPNSSDFDLRDFVDREMEKKARSRQADSPVFFGGFPLLRMTPMDR